MFVSLNTLRMSMDARIILRNRSRPLLTRFLPTLHIFHHGYIRSVGGLDTKMFSTVIVFTQLMS